MSDESDDGFDEDEPIVSARNPELARRMENLRQRAIQADSLAKRALQLVNEKDKRINELETEVQQLRDAVDDIRDDQSMLSQVNDSRAMDVDDRAVVCIQTLVNDAGRDGKASMTISEGWSTLGREFDRTRMYDVFKRAESLVGDGSVCRYKKEPRGHQPPSRLILDRTHEDVPGEIAGTRIRRRDSR